MRTRTLGRTGLAVSEIGFGAWGIGGKQWLNGSDADSLDALHRAIELGINLVDTAFAYNEGHSVQLIADVLPYDYIVDMTEQSLCNLKTEGIGLQQFHVWNPEWLASDDWRRGIEDLKKTGKVRYFGISINGDHKAQIARGAPFWETRIWQRRRCGLHFQTLASPR